MSSTGTEQKTAERRVIGTPEGFMNTENAHPVDLHDALNCVLQRARSTTILLSTQFEDPEADRCNDDIIANVIWSLQGQIEQALKLAENPPT